MAIFMLLGNKVQLSEHFIQTIASSAQNIYRLKRFSSLVTGVSQAMLLIIHTKLQGILDISCCTENKVSSEKNRHLPLYVSVLGSRVDTAVTTSGPSWLFG